MLSLQVEILNISVVYLSDMKIFVLMLINEVH